LPQIFAQTSFGIWNLFFGILIPRRLARPCRSDGPRGYLLLMQPLEIIHITAECYPVAKVGDLGDSVGAMVMNQNELGIRAKVIMPYYGTPFVKQENFDSIFEEHILLNTKRYSCKVLIPRRRIVWFDLFLVHVEGLPDEEKIYSEKEDAERFIAFQRVTLDFLNQLAKKPNVIHCHDHHAGLVPFMLLHCQEYSELRNIPTILTIHNAHYQGIFGHEKLGLLPLFNHIHLGLLEWNNVINPLAAGVKCAWRVGTVSPSYLEELKSNGNVLKRLFVKEGKKCQGILNGINTSEWNPETDDALIKKYSTRSVESGKKVNKNSLCNKFLKPEKPLFVFIGRLIWENGADLLPGLLKDLLKSDKNDGNYIVLGSEGLSVANALKSLEKIHPTKLTVQYSNDERMKRRILAGADFLLLPSRTDPAGNRQMLAMRYGTIPVVNNVGALNDTVIDIKKEDGFGIKHKGVSIKRIRNAIFRAQRLYLDQERFKKIRVIAMKKDHSWRSSVKEYIDLYRELDKLK